MWVLAALFMLIPIVMLILSLVAPYPAIRWVTIVAAAVLVVFNIAGLPYESVFDNLLIGDIISCPGLDYCALATARSTCCSSWPKQAWARTSRPASRT